MDEAVSIGRGNGAVIQLDGPDVSRVHAMLEREGGRLFVTVQGRNGGFRNGARLTAGRRTAVEPGDVIGIAEYEIEIAPAGGPADGLHGPAPKRSMLAPVAGFWRSFTFSEKFTTAAALVSLGVVAVYLTI